MSTTELQVMEIPTPPATRTFRPLPHRALIESLANACDRHSIAVTGKHYSLGREGNRMFGAWEIEQGQTRGAIGFRNANDKSMAVGLTSGDKVMVCSNMAFSGQWIEFRKHTSGMGMFRLHHMVESALGQIMDLIRAFVKWHESLHEYELTKNQGRLMSFCAVEKGVIPPSAIGEVIDLYHNPETGKYEPTLYGWHGAITETLRDRNLVTVQKNHGLLTNMVKDYIKGVK